MATVPRFLNNKALKRYTDLDVKDYYSLLHISENYRVSELKVEKEDWLVDKNLEFLDLGSEGVIVLGIKRHNGNYIGAPVGSTTVREDDILILYGRIKLLRSLEKRKEGHSGDQEHREAVSEQMEIEKDQNEGE